MMHESCTTLKGVGERIAGWLAKLGMCTVQDLLFHLPIRYQDRTKITPMHQLQVGMQIVVEGVVETSQIVYRPRRNLLCRLGDDTGVVHLRFFHFNQNQYRALSPGAQVRCFGEVQKHTDEFWIVHPQYEIIDPDHPVPLEPYLTPVYPTTEGLAQTRLRAIISQALERLEEIEEWVPDQLLRQWEVPTLQDALRFVHRPLHARLSERDLYVRRLKLEELLAHQLSLQQMRRAAKKHAAEPLVCYTPSMPKRAVRCSEGPVVQGCKGTGGQEPVPEEYHPVLGRHACVSGQQNNLVSKFIHQLPFPLTASQERVIAEITEDLAKPYPMLRLLQGDVGCGKTVVAIVAALLAVENGCQAAVMAPTEVLAEQHFRNFRRWLEPLGIEVTWLSGQVTGKARRESLQKIAEGVAQIIVGTHALFQEKVTFAHLALAIVDEQHRFGVHQRLALREKGKRGVHYPHQLIMTATPIPRTLMMSYYADLDHSIIDALPPGRGTIHTLMISHKRRAEVMDRIQNLCAAGQQVYWVCPLIEESEKLQCEAAEKTAAAFVEALPHLRIGLMHGRMPSDAKDEAMQVFTSGKYDVLVATTVIEVGVDVPNATLMVLENPERFGLAQLHQLRGRIGRGTHDGYCILLYQTPLSAKARERLEHIRNNQDGFAIAEKDLTLRGPGEILGVRQSGEMDLRIADVMRDQALLPMAQHAATQLFTHFPNHVQPLIDRWIGDRQRCASV